MATERAKVKAEIEALVADGVKLYNDEAKHHAALLKHERSEAQSQPPSAPFSFSVRYHAWYSKALPLVRQLMPDRREEFEQYFRDPRRKEMNLMTYTIQDHIAGIHMRNHELAQWRSLALNRLSSQLSIVESISDGLDSLLADVAGVLQAELLDDEISVARELVKKKHLRAAGAVAGVVLERHLAHVATSRNVTIRKANPTIADLNDPLKNTGAYDVPEWRRIQRLADLRNLCVHHKEREPTPDEVEELVTGAERVTKTIF
jgi:hypothetical protein